MSKVIKSRQTKEGVIVLEYDDGSSKQFFEIRCGLSWPLTDERNLPGYYCIIGEELISAPQRKMNLRGKLIQLKECEAPDITMPLPVFLGKLIDDLKLYMCKTVYAVTGKFEGEDYSGKAKMFHEIMYDKEIAVHLEEPLWADQPDLGRDYIQLWRNKGLLELENESIVYGQLGKVTNTNIKQIASTLNAVNALRFVVCGFKEYKPKLTPEGDWRDRAPKGSWRTG